MSAHKLSARQVRHWYLAWLAEVLESKASCTAPGWDHGLKSTHESLGPTPASVGRRLGFIDHNRPERRDVRCQQFAEYRRRQADKAAAAAEKAAPPRVMFSAANQRGIEWVTLDGEKVGLIMLTDGLSDLGIPDRYQVTLTDVRDALGVSRMEHHYPECAVVDPDGDPRKNKRAARAAARNWVKQRLLKGENE